MVRASPHYLSTDLTPPQKSSGGVYCASTQLHTTRRWHWNRGLPQSSLTPWARSPKRRIQMRPGTQRGLNFQGFGHSHWVLFRQLSKCCLAPDPDGCTGRACHTLLVKGFHSGGCESTSGRSLGQGYVEMLTGMMVGVAPLMMPRSKEFMMASSPISPSAPLNKGFLPNTCFPSNRTNFGLHGWPGRFGR